jgi:D-alanine-D-alanine ligase
LRTKALLQHKGLPTPAFALAKLDEKFNLPDTLNFPLIVKPPYEDASQGISCDSVVENRRALLKRISYIHEIYQQPALVEEYIPGRELNVAILGSSKPQVLPLSEITFAPELARAIVCFDSKWSPESAAYRGTKPVCPAQLNPKDRLLINMIATRAYQLLGCRDYARVDIRLNNHTPYILEVNANPDISPDAGLARSAMSTGLSYPQLIELIVKDAMRRKEHLHA